MKSKYIGVCVPKDNSRKNSVFLYPFYWCFETITKMIVDNDCIPIFIQYEGNMVDKYLELIDGLILVGDRDINPKYYGEELKEIDEEMGLMSDDRMNFQLDILDKILIKKEKKVPILGICAGMQSINVAMGGTLMQDIGKEINTKIEHRQAKRGLTDIAHYIDIVDKNSFIYKTTQQEHFGITSNHHQAIKRLAEGFKITAISSEDRIIEAIEFCGDSICIGFQWHLERYASENDITLLKNFFKIC